jgi:hypothetical protein
MFVADFLLHMGVPTYIDAEHAIAHNKIMIIDGQTVLTGSFNFTTEEHNKFGCKLHPLLDFSPSSLKLSPMSEITQLSPKQLRRAARAVT